MGADPITAPVLIGAAVAGGLISAGGSIAGGMAQAGAIEDSIEAQWAMYRQQREDFAPWRETGVRALGELERRVTAGPGEYTQSPDYRFLMEQGTEALNRNAAAAHTLDSGAHEKALLSFGQGLASTDYDKFLNRYYQSLNPYQSLAGVGQTATGQLAQIGSNTALNVSNAQMEQGAARASSYHDLANSFRGGLSDYMFLNALKGSGGGGVDNYGQNAATYGAVPQGIY